MKGLWAYTNEFSAPDNSFFFGMNLWVSSSIFLAILWECYGYLSCDDMEMLWVAFSCDFMGSYEYLSCDDMEMLWVSFFLRCYGKRAFTPFAHTKTFTKWNSFSSASQAMRPVTQQDSDIYPIEGMMIRQNR